MAGGPGLSDDAPAPALVAGVVPDVAAIDRVLDYLVPAPLAADVEVGTIVRVPLQGRRVRGWVVRLGWAARPERVLRPIAKVTGYGPPADLLALAEWAAWRWAGPRLTFLRAASPERAVRQVPVLAARWSRGSATASPAAATMGRPATTAGSTAAPHGPVGAQGAPPDTGGALQYHTGRDDPARNDPHREVTGGEHSDREIPKRQDVDRHDANWNDPRPPSIGGSAAPQQAASSALDGGARTSEQPALLADAFGGGTKVLRWPPSADPYPIVAAAAARGQALVLAPANEDAAWLASRLAQSGTLVATWPDGWAQAAGGATIVGSRAAAWAPAPSLAAVVVLDCHDDRYQSERAPTWDARAVAVERARRAEVPCVLVSPAPPLDLVERMPMVVPSRAAERAGWPPLRIVDRRADDPRTGLFSEPFVSLLRSGVSMVAVLNRAGRAKLLACSRCGAVVRCERCDGGMVAPTAGVLECRRCEHRRPELCLACGATRLAVLRAGVGRAREELEALAGRPVEEVTAAAAPGPRRALQAGEVVVGTAAALHRVRRADVVAFLDIDQELLAPRYRAGEQAMALLVLAARMVGGRRGRGSILVQTRAPDHEVLAAVLHADSSKLTVVDAARRRALGYPPFRALALLEGPGAPAAAAWAAAHLGLEVLGPADGRYLLRATDDTRLAEALAGLPRGPDRLRVEVGPLRA